MFVLYYLTNNPELAVLKQTQFSLCPMESEPEFFKLLRNPRIDSKESILPVYVCSLAGQYNNPITIHFLVPLNCLKILAQL
jgi:hypothetical protein